MPNMKNFSYYIKEAISNLFTNRIVTLTTVITVTVALFIIGIFEIVSSNMVYVSNSLGNDFEFHIYISDSVAPQELNAVAQEIKSVENVKEAVLKTKQDTLFELQRELGDTSALAGITEKHNPFRNSFVVTVTDLSQSETTMNSIKRIPQVESVADNIATSKKIDDVTKKVQIYSIIAYVLLALLCLSIVSNIINVSIFSRRKHINIMKYVGATDSFVKIPFILEGIIIGFLGAVISAGVLIYVYYLLFGKLDNVINGMHLKQVLDVAKSLIISNTAFGLVIGGLGASYAVGKYLKV